MQLHANDRIIFGTSSTFLFRHQDKAAGAKVQDNAEHRITHQFAMQEKGDFDHQKEAKQRAADKAKLDAETAAKLKEMQDKMDAERAKKLAEKAALIAAYEAKMKALQDEIATK